MTAPSQEFRPLTTGPVLTEQVGAAAHQATLFGSDDFAEGIAAFRENRRAVFGTDGGVRE